MGRPRWNFRENSLCYNSTRLYIIWVQSLIWILSWSLLWLMQKCVTTTRILDCIMTRLHSHGESSPQQGTKNVSYTTQDINCLGPFYWHGLTLILAWINNDIHCKVWDEITHPFPNFNGVAVEVWEWISNFIPHFTGHVITYPSWD